MKKVEIFWHYPPQRSLWTPSYLAWYVMTTVSLPAGNTCVISSCVLTTTYRYEILQGTQKKYGTVLCWRKTSGWSSKFRPILATQEPLTAFHGFWQKIPKCPIQKKNTVFKAINSQYFFVKLSEVSPWVSRINWCDGHQCDMTDMVVRLYDVRPKTGKKCMKICYDTDELKSTLGNGPWNSSSDLQTR